MAPIDTSEAWRIICALRAATHESDRRIEGVSVASGGAWRTARAVQPDAAQLFDTLLPLVSSGPAWVVAQIGQSLDGYIATASGDSHYVTGKASRVHLHRLRALADAVVVGVGTVVADDPALTVRHVTGANPARVVLDPNARAPHGTQVFTERGAAAWHAVCDPARAAPGALPLALPRGTPAAMAQALLQQLARHGLRRVLVEGGGITISHFLDAGLLDRLHVMVAPLLLGSGRRTLNLTAITALTDAWRPCCHSYPLGDDRLYDLDLRRTAG